MADTQPIPAGDPPAADSSTTAAAPTAAPVASRHRGRRITSWVLVVLIFILTPLTLAAGWTRLILANERAYVAATSPLASEQAVQTAIEDRVTTAVMTQVDQLNLDQQVIDWLNGFQRMPDQVLTAATALMSSLNSGLENVVRNAVTDVVTSPQFQQIWDTLQTVAHNQFTKIMDGSSVLLTEEGGLALQLQPVVAAVRQHMVDNGRAWAANIPDTQVKYDLLSPAQTKALQGYYKLATSAFWALLAVWVVLAAVAVLLALNRPKGIVRVAVATLLGALLLAVGLRVVENILAADTANLQNPGAVTAILRDVLSGLRTGIRITAGLALVVAVVAWVFTGSRAALAVRRGAGTLWGPAADPHAVLIRRIVAGSVAVVLGCVLLFADLSTAWTVVLAFLLLAAVVLTLLPGPADADEPGSSGPAAVGPTGKTGPPAVTAGS